MTFPISPGVYPREVDKSFVIAPAANSIGGIVIHSDKGTTGALELITNNKQFIDKYGKPSPDDPSMYAALAFLEQGKRLYVARAINDAVAASYDVLDTATSLVTQFTINAHDEGVWGNGITVTTSAIVSDVFTLTVFDATVQVEEFEVSRITTKLDGFGRSQYIEDVINGVSNYISIVDTTATDAWTALAAQALDDVAGADDTVAVSDANINLEWDRFANKLEIEVSLLINAGFATASVVTKMVGIAEARQDCIAILDTIQADVTVAAMQTYRNTTINTNSSYAALYGGWVKIYDQYNDKQLFVPPSGYVAGVYAKTAEVSEVWFAPAGQRRGVLNVLGVNVIFTEGERDTLQTDQINPIQNFTGEGIQVYGQKTLQTAASATDRVNVRMLMITIEKAIARALKPFVFEFNDVFTRENIASIINNYMGDIQTRRGVVDFLTIVDETNNTAQVIDTNQLIIDLYVKPTRVAEYIRLNAVITATGAQFTVS